MNDAERARRRRTKVTGPCCKNPGYPGLPCLPCWAKAGRVQEALVFWRRSGLEAEALLELQRLGYAQGSR